MNARKKDCNGHSRVCGLLKHALPFFLVCAVLFGGNMPAYFLNGLSLFSNGESISGVVHGNPPPPPATLVVDAIGDAAHVTVTENGNVSDLYRELQGANDFPADIVPSPSTTVTLNAHDYDGWYFIRWEWYVNGVFHGDNQENITVTVSSTILRTARYMKADIVITDGSGGTGVSDELESTRGGYAKANLNDTDGDECIDAEQSPVPGEVDLIQVTLNPPEPYLQGMGLFSVTSSGPEYKVWLTPSKDAEATTLTFDGTSPVTFYVEGLEASSSPGNVSLSYSFMPFAGGFVNGPHDYGKATFLHFRLNVVCANGFDHKSFTTWPSEDDVNCTGYLSPSALLAMYNENVYWEIQGDVEPKQVAPGTSQHLLATAPPAPDGRSEPLDGTIRAFVTIEGIAFDEEQEIEQDEDDYLRQQYIDVVDNGPPPVHYIDVPARGSLDSNDTFAENHHGPMTFGQCQCQCTRPHAVLFCQTAAAGYAACSSAYGGYITTTCVFRCPAHNKEEGSEITSKHPIGHAFDFDELSSAANWNVAEAASDALIPEGRILLYKNRTVSMNLRELITLGCDATHFPSGWTEYAFGHVTTGVDPN
jgi:hypothetical protein